MKILLVNKFLHPNGGSETYIFKLAEQLEVLGHEVQFFGMENEGRIVSNNLDIYTDNMDFRGTASSLKSKISKVLYPFKIIYSTEAKRKIRKVLDDMQPDVVHLNNINFQLTPSIILAVREYATRNNRRVKIVYTAHDYQWICPNHMLYTHNEVCERCVDGRFICCAENRCIHNSLIKSCIGSIEGYFYSIKRAYEQVDTVIAPSHFMGDMLSHRRDINSKIVVLQNFIDSTRISDVSKDDRKYVLYFGRLDHEKGIDLIVDTALRHPDIQFKIAGNGQLIDKLKEIKNIEYLGFVTGTKLTELIQKAAFTVYPAMWFENCPFSIMESISLGTPVLGSNLGGIPELVEDEYNGELFKPGDIVDFDSHVVKLWNNEEIVEYYSSNCSKHKFMGIGEYVSRLLEIYQ